MRVSAEARFEAADASLPGAADVCVLTDASGGFDTTGFSPADDLVATFAAGVTVVDAATGLAAAGVATSVDVLCSVCVDNGSSPRVMSTTTAVLTSATAIMGNPLRNQAIGAALRVLRGVGVTLG